MLLSLVSSKTRILLIALVLSVVTFPVGQIETASAEPSTGLFTAENVEGIGAAFGCMGAACPTEKRAMLGFKKQSTYPELAEASRIVTAPVPPPGPETTGCAIIATALKCFGKNTFGRIGNETSAATTDSFVSATKGGTPLTGVTDVDVTTETTCAIQSQKILCIGREEFTIGQAETWKPSTPPTWFEMPSEPALQLHLHIQSKAPNISINTYAVPLLCVRFASLRVGCSWVNPTPKWWYLNVDGVTDIDGSRGEAFDSQLCYAGNKSGCVRIKEGNLTQVSEFPDMAGASRMYWKGNAVLFYKAGALWSVPQRFSAESFVKPHMVGYMDEPLSFLYNGGFEQVIVMRTGFISVPPFALSCEDCYSNAQGILSPMTSFVEANSSTYYSIESVETITNTLTFLPFKFTSGNRKAGLTKKLKLKTYSGEAVAGAMVAWRSTDVALGLKSSEGSAFSSGTGEITVTSNTGPLTFSIVGGTLKSGASLQGAYVTRTFESGMDTNIEVPDPEVLIDRKVTVVNSAGAPIPNAELTLLNSYLTYTFSTEGPDTAIWGAQPIDPRGYFLEPSCPFCYTPPPAYITGTDGSVTFRSFDAKSKSSANDALVGYDDGVLKKSVEYSFTSGESTVTLPDMPTLLSTAEDTDIKTTDIDVVPDAQGNASIEIGLVDGSQSGVLKAMVEPVCEEMETGSLWSSTLNVNNLCQGKTVASVRSMAAKCPVAQGRSIKAGEKLSVALCATSSTRVRIRANGAVAGKSICIVVRGKPCAKRSLVVGKNKTITGTKKIVPRGSKLVLAKFLPATPGTTATYSVTQPCAIKKGVLAVQSRAGVCVVTKIEIASARSLKGKSSVTRIPIISR